MATDTDTTARGWQTVSIPFIAGLETKMAQAVIPAQKLSVLENGVFTKTGSVKKRAGYTAVPDYTTSGAIEGNRRALLSAQDDLAMVSDRAVYSRTVDTWQSRGAYLAATAQHWDVAHANRNQLAADVAVVNNVAVVVWKYAANSLYFQAFDAMTRAPLSAVTPLAVATANYPSAMVIGTNILLFYVDTSGNNLKARVIRTSDLAASIATAQLVTVLPDLTAAGLYCVTPTLPGEAAIAYLSDGSGSLNATGLTAVKVNSSGTVSNAVLVDTGTPDHNPAIAYNANTNQLCVAYSIAASSSWNVLIGYTTMSAGSAVDLGVQGVRLAVVPLPTLDVTGGNAFVTAAQITAATSDIYFTDLIPNVTLTPVVVRHAHIASQGFTLAGRGCFMLAHDSRTGLQSANYIYDTAGRCLGSVEQGTAVGRASDSELPHMSDGHMVLHTKRALSVDKFQAQFSHAGIRMYEFSETGKIASAEYGAATYMSGCQLWLYDGNAPVEAGMHMFPDVKLGGTCSAGDGGTVGDFTQLAAGSNLADATQYNYRFYYEWYTATGERIRSLPMQRSVTTSIASCSMQMVIPTLRHTLKSATHARQAEVSIVVYRTQGNLSDVFYRVSSPDPAATGDNKYLANSFAADTVTFNDDMADTALLSKERDYFSLNELLNFPVPGPEVLYATADRLYLAGGGIPRGMVLPSKTHVAGDAAAFAEELDTQVTVDDITALSSLDETVVTFTRDAIYLLGGSGFDNTGGGDPFNVSRITSDVGCTERGSAIQVPGGVMWKSAKGIYSVDQQGGVQYIGAPVEAYNGQLVHSVKVIPDTNQVLFLCSEGVTLMYDYLYGQWGTFTQHQGIDSVVYGTDYAYLRNDGTVYVRNVDLYTDAGSPVILRLRTGRYRPDDMQGFFLLRQFAVLGEYRSPHKLAVRLLRNRSDVPVRTIIFDPSFLNTTTWGSSTTWGSDAYWGGTGALPDYHFIRRPRQSKYSEVAFEFEDIITEQAGASFELTELLLEVKVRPGLERLGQRRRI